MFSSFPFEHALRYRAVVVTAICLIGGLVASEYGFRIPVYRAVSVVDAPSASAYQVGPASSGNGDPAASAAGAREARSRRDESLLNASIIKAGVVGTIHRGNRMRRKVPRLVLRRTGESDIVRIVVVADSPAAAAAIANAAARILVREERRLYRTRIQQESATGSVPSALVESGTQIGIFTRAVAPPAQNRLKRLAAQVVGAGLLLISLCLAFVLAMDSQAGRRVAKAGLGSLSDLTVPVASWLRMTPSANEKESAVGPASFSAAPELLEHIDAWLSSPMRLSESTPPTIAVAPALDYFDNAGISAAKCRACADYLARLIAARGCRTLLIDADINRSSSRQMGGIGVPIMPGLSEALSGQSVATDWLLVDDRLPNLFALSAGRAVVADDELGADSMIRLLASCSHFADLIVVNAGCIPIELSESAFWSGAGSWCSGMLVINESGDVDSDVVRGAAAVLLSAQIPVVGQFTWTQS